MEQFRLPLENPENTQEQSDADLEKLTLVELQALYHTKVGINPRARAFDIPTLVAGIQSPETEKDRIRDIDRESDQTDIVDTYRKK